LSNLRLVLVFVAIAFTLGACSGSSQPFGKEPKLFSTRLLKTPPAIKIAKINGLSTENSQSLRRQFIREARKRGLSAGADNKGKAAVFIKATLKVAPYGQGTAVAYVWDVSDKRKKRLLRVAGEDVSKKSPNDQSSAQLSTKTIQRIAAHASSGLASWLSRQGYRVREVSLPPPSAVRNASILRTEASSVAARQSISRSLYKASGKPRSRTTKLSSPQLAQPALAPPHNGNAPNSTASVTTARSLRSGEQKKQQTMVQIVPVTGASAQANIELTRSIKRALRSNGVRITDKPTSSSLKLVGIVKMGPIKQRQRVIEINWNLNNTFGKRIGLVQQKNKIEADLVANSWGQIAVAATQAAAGDIAGIIPDTVRVSQR